MSRRTPTEPTATRRAFLAATAGVAAAGALPATAGAQADTLEGWFEDANEYDGLVDATGEAEVHVTVGAGDGFAFDPAAIRVDPGTRVVWEWIGEGGSHNVVATDETFESDLVGDEGATFEHTFEEEGITRYSCTPHEAGGMKGVVVGDVDASTGGADAETSSGIPLLPGVGAALVIIAGTAGAIARWVGAGRDESRVEERTARSRSPTRRPVAEPVGRLAHQAVIVTSVSGSASGTRTRPPVACETEHSVSPLIALQPPPSGRATATCEADSRPNRRRRGWCRPVAPY